ncbi:damage-control phosphatase ARMT1-like [Gordionus sp. m RMFG-2023]|uniref:damage-control phosphatase ARMT1-like n=1 Tax=Gordionus sp. m RMFG-2023 TaxID=3053472 RepID=UPI0031FC3886
MTYPDSLSAKDEESFAYVTIKYRLPTILGKVIDFFNRCSKDFRASYGIEVEKDIEEINGALLKLNYQLRNNKAIEKFRSDKNDIDFWNVEFERILNSNSKINWHESPWLFVESYMYRNINEIFYKSKYLQDFDPFFESKHKSFKNSINNIYIICEYIYMLEKIGWENIELQEIFNKILKISLWGNKFDLSLSNMNVLQVSENLLDKLQTYDQHIICDDSQQIFEYLIKKKNETNDNILNENGNQVINHSNNRIINLIIDNSGFELFTDLVLVYFLLKTNLADKILIRGKNMPWFVSDATAKDLKSLLTWLLYPDNNKEGNCICNGLYVSEILNQLPKTNKTQELDNNMNYYGVWFAQEILKLMGNFLAIPEKETVKNSKPSLIYIDNMYWTLPNDYDAMMELDPKLYEELSESLLIIFKGDLNFRKLVGDLKWDPQTPFKHSLRRFTPAPLVTLRTVKSDTIVGLSPETIKISNLTYPKNWKFTGNYAIIYFNQ